MGEFKCEVEDCEQRDNGACSMDGECWDYVPADDDDEDNRPI